MAPDRGVPAGVLPTLTLADVSSGWTEPRPSRQGRPMVDEAPSAMDRDLHMPMLGFDSAKGSEFINVIRRAGVTFTRAGLQRELRGATWSTRKGDVVRQAVGYLRLARFPRLA